MKFNPEDWKQKAHENFEAAWHEGPSVITPSGQDGKYPRLSYKRAQAHPVFETINRLREIYLALGFDEIENPVIVEEKDIYRQFGPEAMAVLDRVFYLGGLPRPNVGIAKKQLDEINDILQSHRSGLVHGHPVPAEEHRNKEPFQLMSKRPKSGSVKHSIHIKNQRSMGTNSPSSWQKFSGLMTGSLCIFSMRYSRSSKRLFPSRHAAL